MSIEDVEAAAEAMFNAFHTREHRFRVWAVHPDEDNGAEHGRDAFRAMAEAALKLFEIQEPTVVMSSAHGTVEMAIPQDPSDWSAKEEDKDG